MTKMYIAGNIKRRVATPHRRWKLCGLRKYWNQKSTFKKRKIFSFIRKIAILKIFYTVSLDYFIIPDRYPRKSKIPCRCHIQIILASENQHAQLCCFLQNFVLYWIHYHGSAHEKHMHLKSDDRGWCFCLHYLDLHHISYMD